MNWLFYAFLYYILKLLDTHIAHKDFSFLHELTFYADAYYYLLLIDNHFMKKSGEGLSTAKPSEVEAKKVVEDIESFEKENSVRELKNAFEILMKKMGVIRNKKHLEKDWKD